MPLFTIKAQAGVDMKAARVVITRSGNAKPEIFELNSTETDNILVYEGDKIEFVGTGEQKLIQGRR
jgi:hypothetical protein